MYQITSPPLIFAFYMLFVSVQNKISYSTSKKKYSWRIIFFLFILHEIFILWFPPRQQEQHGFVYNLKLAEKLSWKAKDKKEQKLKHDDNTRDVVVEF